MKERKNIRFGVGSDDVTRKTRSRRFIGRRLSASEQNCSFFQNNVIVLARF